MEDRNLLCRMPDESDFAYHRRVVYGKLVDRTLSDYDYSELAQYVYGEEMSPEFARKLMYGSKRTLELFDKERASIDGASMLKEITDQTIELQKQSQRYFDQRREYNKIVAREGRWEHLESVLADAADRVTGSIGKIYSDVRFSDVLQGADKTSEAVLVLSDWHYGMTADNVFNHYNTDVCVERVDHVAQEAIRRIMLHKCAKLHIVVLGDLIHGGVHASARVASEELVADQLMQVSEILAQTIEYLSQFVEHTYVYMTYGNHARTIQNKKDSIHRDNMERIIPWWLAERMKHHDNINIVAESDNEFLMLDVAGHVFCASHGDLDTVKTSPRLLSTLFQKKYGLDVEYILLGDKHHRETFEEIDVCAMICGSLCGTDDYANSKRLYSRPEQLLLIVNEEFGVDAEYRIRC